MNKPLDLPDVTLEEVIRRPPAGQPTQRHLSIVHKKTGMETILTADRLNAWLLRQLRQELVSTREKT